MFLKRRVLIKSYKKMYLALLHPVNDLTDLLEKQSKALHLESERLKAVMREAEDIYLSHDEEE